MALSRITNYIEADGADLNLQSSDTTITASSVLGVINFKAPSEASGTDAILLASKIEAVAEGTFSASSNATSLVFSTASSAAAGTVAGKMTFTSGGELVIKDTDTADGSSPTITLQSGDTDIAQDDVLGTINFQAPDEGTGTDAVLVSGAIQARAETDFSSSVNKTSLDLMTGASEAATTKLTITSDGRGLSQFTAKVWCNYNGNGNAVRDSHNVSSVDDNEGTSHASLKDLQLYEKQRRLISCESLIGCLIEILYNQLLLL